MGIHVVDVFNRAGCEAGALPVVVELHARYRLTVVCRHRVVLQVSDQAQLHQVNPVEIVGTPLLRGACIESILVGESA